MWQRKLDSYCHCCSCIPSLNLGNVFVYIFTSVSAWVQCKLQSKRRRRVFSSIWTMAVQNLFTYFHKISSSAVLLFSWFCKMITPSVSSRSTDSVDRECWPAIYTVFNINTIVVGEMSDYTWHTEDDKQSRCQTQTILATMRSGRKLLSILVAYRLHGFGFVKQVRWYS